MNNILTVDEAIKVSEQLRLQGKTIVVAGGCFDILHIGHIEFLEKAKTQANALFLLLESDEKIQHSKGPGRPINNQLDRAKVLHSLKTVDYVVLLPSICTNEAYDGIIHGLKPVLIATTQGDPHRAHKERQAEKIGAKVVDVIKPVLSKSTSRIASLLSEEI